MNARARQPVPTAARPAASFPRYEGLGFPRLTFMKTRSLILFVSVLFSGVFFSGCSSASLVRVKPWERATLADYTMRPDRDPLHNALAEHVYFSRETATGGRGVGGSGCGCN